MKLASVSLLVISLSAIAFAADPLAGKWSVHSSIAGNESDQSCTWSQKDSDLSGTCTSDRGNVTISGKVDGKKVTWSYKSEYNGTPLTVSYEGTLDSETKISGTVTVPEFSADGNFTATQTK